MKPLQGITHLETERAVPPKKANSHLQLKSLLNEVTLISELQLALLTKKSYIALIKKFNNWKLFSTLTTNANIYKTHKYLSQNVAKQVFLQL